MRKYDLDSDGKVSMTDIQESDALLELELREAKASTQKKMAWVAMASMLIFTVGLFTPLVSDNRVNALGNLLGLFYLAQAGVVGAYMGVTAWMSNNSSQYGQYGSGRYTSRSMGDDPIKGRD